MKKIITLSILFLVMVFSQAIYKGGDVRLSPRMLNYQGYLTDTLGNPITNSSVSMTFSIYDALSAGNLKWNETQGSVSVSKGIFSVLLGSVTIIPDSIFNNSAIRYLQLTVAGQVLSPRTRIVSSAYAISSTYADTAAYARNYAPDNKWTYLVSNGSDTTLQTGGRWGLARQGNILHGNADSTHVNFGVACTTGTNGQNYKFCTVGGGFLNSAGNEYASVAGGSFNRASGYAGAVEGGIGNIASGYIAAAGGGFGNTAGGNYATVTGGMSNTASGVVSTMGGGYNNMAGGDYSVVVGGQYDTASAYVATVCGGRSNKANSTGAFVGGGESNVASGDHASVGGGQYNTAGNEYATVAGGYNNTASGYRATVSGGYSNTASLDYATVAGGWKNAASGYYAAVAGGINDSSLADYSFTANSYSKVPAGYSYSAAFNGLTATAAGQTRVGVLSKNAGSFTIDHPLDPEHKILNHYFVESPEMSNIYEGETVLDGSGRAEVILPDYFDALNRSPRIQLTGIGTSDVYVVEKVKDNRFVIGGKPGADVYWMVTGSRKDPSAEIARILMPVEQVKEGALIGQSLDDEFLVTTMAQLERMGQSAGFKFRHASEQKRYEKMKQHLERDNK
jgi:hypothetical protein